MAALRWHWQVIAILVAMIFTFIPVATFSYYDSDQGKYCEDQRYGGCCTDRQDDCSVPIDGTLCYCDQFCNRTLNADCCPDYRSHCLGIIEPPLPLRKCYHNGIYFSQFDQPIKDNCNLCKCVDGQTTCDTNVCLVDNDLVNNVNMEYSNWKAKNYSEFWGRTYSEGMILRTGTFEPMYSVKRMTRVSNKKDGIPPSFDARDHWRGLVSEPKDQGWCGSSFVVSTAAVASDRFAIQSKGKELVDLSAQQLLSCVRKQQGCNGGHLDVAWSYLRKMGVVEESCMQYVAKPNRCKVRYRDNLESLGCELPTKVPRKDLYKMGPAYALNNETDIMKEILTSGPVQATMRVYRDFFTYGSGIYRHTSASRSDATGFHSVKLIGWGEENGEKYWLAANSWGTWWGENGYFRILRGQNESEIENYVLASWADVFTKPKSAPARRGFRG